MILSNSDKELLISLAWQSLQHAVLHGSVMPLPRRKLPKPLRQNCATFVTLHYQGELRGCIGVIDPVRPLAEDVIFNAYAAAYRDPRFNPLSAREMPGISLSISVLTLREYLSFDSQTSLLELIRPGVDGLVLEDQCHCGAFLPVMWEQLPEPTQFLFHLKRKAGLPPDYWSPTLRVSRFRAEYYLESERCPDML